MAVPVVLAGMDVPKRRLLAVAAPVRHRRSSHRVPAWFVLPVIVAAAKRKPVLGPDDLGANIEADRRQRILHHAGVTAGVPDVGDGPRKQRPGLAPVVLIVVDDLAQLAGIEVDTGALAPRGVVADAVRVDRSPSDAD